MSSNRTWKKNGMTREQELNMIDVATSANFTGLANKGLKCPICGRKSSGVRPEGYQHRGTRAGIETTYCKRGEQHEEDNKT